MRYKPKNFILKDGTEILLRTPEPGDARKLIDFLKITSGETYFLLRNPEDVNYTEKEETEILKSSAESDKNIMISVFINEEVVGNAGISCIRDLPKTQHRAGIAICIQKKCWNKGIGTILMKEISSMAKSMGYEQIELGVYEDNSRAKKLYEQFGFQEWGRTRKAFKLKDGTYRDEIVMGKFL